MKKFFVFICLALFITGFAAAQYGPGRVLYAVVKTIDLKSSTGLFASTVTTLKYGDQVTVIRADGKYVEVASAADSSLTGWAQAVNFSTKRVTAENVTSTSAKEIALAGKGFNQDVENSYRAQGELDFADVDKVEALTADDAKLGSFLEEGQLSTGK